jgi:hypothetical protein
LLKTGNLSTVKNGRETVTRCRAGVLKILILDKLDDDVLLGLDLQHLEDEAEKWRGLDVSAEYAANKL